MTQARKSLISLETTPYYHVIGRCVRRAFLWGVDGFSGKDYSHRKSWVIERLNTLSAIFTIDVCAYAVMSNHYHLVLRVNAERAQQLSEREIAERWKKLFVWPLIVTRYFQNEEISQAEKEVAQNLIAQWRHRLSDVSWYMRSLNEYLARRANAEDGCKGRFWEGRFKSQALLDDVAVLACMAYVDLNPVRAGIAATPELSDFTSIQQRLKDIGVIKDNKTSTPNKSIPLLPFTGNYRDQQTAIGIPQTLLEYCELIDWTGRQLRPDKRGSISANTPALLQRLNLSTEQFLKRMKNKSPSKGKAAGLKTNLHQFAQTIGQRRVLGVAW